MTDGALPVIGDEVLQTAIRARRDFPVEAQLIILEELGGNDVSAPPAFGMVQTAVDDGPAIGGKRRLIEAAPTVRGAAIEQQAPPGRAFVLGENVGGVIPRRNGEHRTKKDTKHRTPTQPSPWHIGQSAKKDGGRESISNFPAFVRGRGWIISHRVSTTTATATTASGGSEDDRFPKQIKFIVGNEACERFSYYGMRSLLMLYITKILNKTDDQATEIIHYFISANYFMPLLGAWLSDRLIGRYHTILWISLFYCAGHGVLAMSDLTTSVENKTMLLYLGLALIAFGSGGIKPCVSAFVGDQFKPNQSHLLQKAYGAFYWSINFGSFFSFLLIPWIKDHYGYGWAFGVPGILMAIATLIFWLGTPHYTRIPPSRETKTAGFFPILWYALTHLAARKPGQGFWDVARARYSAEEVSAAASVGPVLGIFLLIPPFWALFDQSTSTWVEQGTRMRSFELWGISITAEQMQSANPALVMILVPLLTLIVYPAVGRLATPLRRMGTGLAISAVSFLIVAWFQHRIENGDSISLAWQILPYIVLTTGEVLVSTTGLEFAFTEAGKQMKSTIMSFWLLTVSVGNLLVSWVTKFAGGGSHDAAVSSGRFLFYAILTFCVAGIFAVAAKFYRYRNPANALGTQRRPAVS